MRNIVGQSTISFSAEPATDGDTITYTVSGPDTSINILNRGSFVSRFTGGKAVIGRESSDFNDKIGDKASTEVQASIEKDTKKPLKKKTKLNPSKKLSA